MRLMAVIVVLFNGRSKVLSLAGASLGNIGDRGGSGERDFTTRGFDDCGDDDDGDGGRVCDGGGDGDDDGVI